MKSNLQIRLGQNKSDSIKCFIFTFSVLTIISVFALINVNIYIVLLLFAVLLYICSKKYCHRDRLIINNDGIIMLGKENGNVYRHSIPWYKIRKIYYRSTSCRAIRTESLIVETCQKEGIHIKKDQIIIDLDNYLPFSFPSLHYVYNKKVDMVLKENCKKNGIIYSLLVS